MHWYEIKDCLELASGLDRDAMHIYAGIAVHFAVALLLRRPLSSWIPWIFVVAAALGNEYADFVSMSQGPISAEIVYAEAARDVLNTVSVPSIILLLAKCCPRFLVRKPSGKEETHDLETEDRDGKHSAH